MENTCFFYINEMRFVVLEYKINYDGKDTIANL